MTGHGSIESAVDAMKLGAYDYIEKPFSRGKKCGCCCSAWQKKVRLVTEKRIPPRGASAPRKSLDGIIGTSANIQDVLRMISRLKKDTRTPVFDLRAKAAQARNW